MKTYLKYYIMMCDALHKFINFYMDCFNIYT